jgi:putative endonuclease
MFFVYVLQSKQDGELYVGSTKDLDRRLEEHTEKKIFSTQFRTPFDLVYYEAYAAEGDARHREQALKLRGQARVQLMKRLPLSLRRSEY